MHEEQNKFIPHLIETSAGLDRAFLAVLTAAYNEEQVNEKDKRIVLKFHPSISPIKAAIIPLAKNNAEIVAYAKGLFAKLKAEEIFPVVLESGGNIGKCYHKHDEIGTPFCVTVDFETIGSGENSDENGNISELKDTFTVRNRDTMEQTRMTINEFIHFVKEAIR